MLKKVLIATGVVVLICILSLAYFIVFPPGPDLAAYEFLKEPRITNLPDQKMIEVRATGDPSSVGKEAFGALFKTFFRLIKDHQWHGDGSAPRTVAQTLQYPAQ
jgi:hypothetical protein